MSVTSNDLKKPHKVEHVEPVSNADPNVNHKKKKERKVKGGSVHKIDKKTLNI